MNLQFQYALSTAITAVTVLGLGIFVFSKNPKATPNRLWALFSLSVFVWATAQSIHIVIDDFSLAYFLIRFYYTFGVLWMPTLSLHFLLAYLNRKERWPLWLAYGFSLTYLTQVFNPQFLAPPQPKFSLTFYPEPGPLHYPFFAVWSAIIIYAVWVLWKELREAPGIRRNQLRYMLFATLIGFVGGMSNYLPVYDIEFF